MFILNLTFLLCSNSMVNEHEFHVLSRGTGVHSKHIFREINYEIGVGKKRYGVNKNIIYGPHSSRHIQSVPLQPTGLGIWLLDRKRPDINIFTTVRLAGFCHTGTGCLEEEISGCRKFQFIPF